MFSLPPNFKAGPADSLLLAALTKPGEWFKLHSVYREDGKIGQLMSS